MNTFLDNLMGNGQVPLDLIDADPGEELAEPRPARLEPGQETDLPNSAQDECRSASGGRVAQLTWD